jgi:hypothetical protein
LKEKVLAKQNQIDEQQKIREMMDFAKELEKMKLYAEGE